MGGMHGTKIAKRLKAQKVHSVEHATAPSGALGVQP